MVAIIMGLVAGVFTSLVRQIAFAKIRSVPIMLAIDALFAAPAGFAGCHAIKGLSEIGGASDRWTLVFARISAIVVAGTALVRIASLADPPGEDEVQHADTMQTSSFANDR